MLHANGEFESRNQPVVCDGLVATQGCNSLENDVQVQLLSGYHVSTGAPQRELQRAPIRAPKAAAPPTSLVVSLPYLWQLQAPHNKHPTFADTALSDVSSNPPQVMKHYFCLLFASTFWPCGQY